MAEAATLTPAQRHRAALEAQGPAACYLAHRGGCRGELQADHPIDRQRIRHAWSRACWLEHPFAELRPADLIADARNGGWLCEVHHSTKWDVKLEQYPAGVQEFADDHGFFFVPGDGWRWAADG
jgi:hypothetical protein